MYIVVVVVVIVVVVTVISHNCILEQGAKIGIIPINFKVTLIILISN